MLSGSGTALVLGLGKVTGRAVIDALLASGIRVRVHESFPASSHRTMADEFGPLGVEFFWGELPGEEAAALVDWADLVVPSPGVPPSSPVLSRALASGKRVVSELELGFAFVQGPVIAITGTNGKTTTTTLLAHILQHAGVAAATAGNIGRPLAEAARSCDPATVLVCEVSSFQLAFIEKFKPSVAVVLNVADDHYDWHTGFEDYVAAKGRITENQDPDNFLIIRAGDPGCLAIASNSHAHILGFGSGTPDEVRAELHLGLGAGVGMVAGVVEGELVVDSASESTTVLKVSDIRLQGVHNLENVMAATLAAISVGISRRDVAEAVKAFESLPHRTSLVATRNGVKYVDDSKATNPHATLRALSGLNNVVLLAGGRAKGLDLTLLAEVASSLSGVVVMGEAAQDLKKVFSGIPTAEALDVEEAVRLASGMAGPGDIVLLSPACSSLDQYSSYAERGDRFKEAVLAL